VDGPYNTVTRTFSLKAIMTHPSMTGFGTSFLDCPMGRLSLEIKSVNSRYFEFNPRLADDFRWAETMVREKIQRRISRGKVECRIGLSRTEASLSALKIHAPGLASALRLAHEIRRDHPEIAMLSVAEILKLPGVTQEHQLSQDELSALIDTLLGQALDQFSQSRHAEGARLTETILDRISRLKVLAKEAQTQLPQAIEVQRQRLSEKLKDAIHGALAASPTQTSATTVTLTAEQQAALDERIRVEAAAFGLRADIAEEIDRLNSHLSAAEKMLSAKESATTSVGKRLDFLTQEMNREANTLGSKAASVELSNIAIDMKLLIEQIREQAQNLE
jgi:uncharacterized protein (TIGR00255 family)